MNRFADFERVFVVAEAGSNWRVGAPRRDMQMARALIDVAADAGADAVKFQTYRPETVYVENAGTSDYLSAAGIRESIRDIFADLAMPYEMLPELAAYCRERDVQFMSTPFSVADARAVDPHVSVNKIASYEISHLRLIEFAARSGKPTIMSTGASDDDDIAWALDTFFKNGGRDVCLMQCTARYPAPVHALNVSVIPRMAERFGVPVGLSDHSRHPFIGPVAAVALGARAIEKHYTLHNRLPGPDHAFAIMPDELATMVEAIRETERARGNGVKTVLPEEQELRTYARRALQATRSIRRGEILHEGTNYDILRPGKQPAGWHPRRLGDVEGRTARRDIAPGQGIREEDVGA